MRTDRILYAARYALIRHEDQSRSGSRNGKFVHYMVHPMEVALILHEVGIEDDDILQAALLHDVLEDTDANPMTLRNKFGDRVADIVQEVTDAPGLKGEERKNNQIQKIPYMTWEAKCIKIADKVSNLRDLLRLSPEWSVEGYSKYLRFSWRLVNAAKPADLVPEPLFRVFDKAYEDGLAYVRTLQANKR